MNKRYQTPLMIALGGIGFAAYTFYDFTVSEVPKLERRLRSKEESLAAKNGELKRLRNFSENIESVKIALRELNLQLESALESMPRDYDLSGLLRKLSVIGFNSGIELSAFRPSGNVKKEGEFYETSPITFNLAGSFTQVLSFFDQALRLKRVIRVERVALRSGAREGQGSVRNPAGVGASAEVIAKLYRFVE